MQLHSTENLTIYLNLLPNSNSFVVISQH